MSKETNIINDPRFTPSKPRSIRFTVVAGMTWETMAANRTYTVLDTELGQDDAQRCIQGQAPEHADVNEPDQSTRPDDMLLLCNVLAHMQNQLADRYGFTADDDGFWSNGPDDTDGLDPVDWIRDDRLVPDLPHRTRMTLTIGSQGDEPVADSARIIGSIEVSSDKTADIAAGTTHATRLQCLRDMDHDHAATVTGLARQWADRVAQAYGLTGDDTQAATRHDDGSNGPEEAPRP